ncbi:Ku protein, partial [Nocardioides sp. GCM10030258]
DYAEAVESVVKAKIEGGEVKRTETSAKTGGEVVDLLAALQRSVEAAKSSRGEDTTPAKEPAKTTAKKAAPARKTAAKKAAAKKTTAKKSPAKKAAAKKAS